MKISTLMDLPSIVLVEKLFTNGNKQIYYPASLLELYKQTTHTPHDSPAGRTSAPSPSKPSSLSPQESIHNMEPLEGPVEGFQNGSGPGSPGIISLEKQRANVNLEISMEEALRNALGNNGLGIASTANVMVTPGNSGDERSIPSSGSGHSFLPNNSGRSSKKRPLSATKNSGNGLETVAEDLPWQHPDPPSKLAKLSEYGLTPNEELMQETGPTQTQKDPIINQPLDHITDSILKHLKSHFDTPGPAKVESLLHLANGMNRKAASTLFYQTCVLATRDYIRVDQRMPYGDILISRGGKM